MNNLLITFLNYFTQSIDKYYQVGNIRRMKVSKVSVSLPEDLVRFATKKIELLRRQRGSRVTLSSYLAERLAEDKSKGEPQKQAA